MPFSFILPTHAPKKRNKSHHCLQILVLLLLLFLFLFTFRFLSRSLFRRHYKIFFRSQLYSFFVLCSSRCSFIRNANKESTSERFRTKELLSVFILTESLLKFQQKQNWTWSMKFDSTVQCKLGSILTISDVKFSMDGMPPVFGEQ